jgi:hypothetical protein
MQLKFSFLIFVSGRCIPKYLRAAPPLLH